MTGFLFWNYFCKRFIKAMCVRNQVLVNKLVWCCLDLQNIFQDHMRLEESGTDRVPVGPLQTPLLSNPVLLELCGFRWRWQHLIQVLRPEVCFNSVLSISYKIQVYVCYLRMADHLTSISSFYDYNLRNNTSSCFFISRSRSFVFKWGHINFAPRLTLRCAKIVAKQHTYMIWVNCVE